MEALYIAFYFIFGAIVGSFLNVVVLRYYLRSSIKGRSICLSCGKVLKWYELIPLFSFLFLRGHCAGCKSKISIQYPLVELGTGILFAGLVLKGYLGISSLVPMVVIALLVAIFVYDIRHKIVPDALVYTFIAISFLSLFVDIQSLQFHGISMPAFFAGPVLFIPFFAMWFFSRGEWMGLGDGKLVLGIGWFLGIAKGISAVALSFWIALVVVLVLFVIQKIKPGNLFKKKLSRKSEIPFTPFLIIGYLIVFYFGFNLAEFIL